MVTGCAYSETCPGEWLLFREFTGDPGDCCASGSCCLSCSFSRASSSASGLAPTGQAATVGSSDPQTGRIVNEDPANFTPHILNGTVVLDRPGRQPGHRGRHLHPGADADSSTTHARNRVFAFNATTGADQHDLQPGAQRHRLQGAADRRPNKSTSAATSAPPQAASSRNLFKVNVTNGADRHRLHRPRPSTARSATSRSSATTCSSPASSPTSAAGPRSALGTAERHHRRADPYFTAHAGRLHRDHDRLPGRRHRRARRSPATPRTPSCRRRQLHQRQRPDPLPDREVQPRRLEHTPCRRGAPTSSRRRAQSTSTPT